MAFQFSGGDGYLSYAICIEEDSLVAQMVFVLNRSWLPTKKKILMLHAKKKKKGIKYN